METGYFKVVGSANGTSFITDRGLTSSIKYMNEIKSD